MLFKVNFTADTRNAPQGATSVRCYVTTDSEVKDALEDVTPGNGGV
jgi:hypothetical protein